MPLRRSRSTRGAASPAATTAARALTAGTPTTARGERRQEAFLAAAAEVFLEHGYTAAPVEEILRRVGGSKASLYRYFGSKEGLFSAVVLAGCDAFLRDIAVPREVEGSLDDTLVRFGQRFFDLYSEPSRVRMLRTVMAEAQRFPMLTEQLYEQGALRARRQLALFFADCHARGLMRAPHPELTAILFVELIKGHCQFRSLMGLSPIGLDISTETFVREAVHTFLHGCGRSLP